ncbi:MAG TPA: HipA domain-containing protein, partial [Paracoccus sp.]|nr:HipA domain-containing protein [Paracoccus sp. (in: a-proteobacteria)]
REMFTRLIFNVLVGNTDDHARNHAAFWTGDTRELTPAYDIAPQRRTSREANQAMTLANGTRAAQLQNVAAIAPAFGVTAAQFRQIVDRLVGTIVTHWSEVCDEAGLSRAEQAGFVGRQFLNDYAFDGYGRVPSLIASRQ